MRDMRGYGDDRLKYEGRGCGDFGYDILSSTSDQNQYFVAVSKAAYDGGVVPY